jgi:hypothetical protein
MGQAGGGAKRTADNCEITIETGRAVTGQVQTKVENPRPSRKLGEAMARIGHAARSSSGAEQCRDVSPRQPTALLLLRKILCNRSFAEIQ